VLGAGIDLRYLFNFDDLEQETIDPADAVVLKRNQLVMSGATNQQLSRTTTRAIQNPHQAGNE